MCASVCYRYWLPFSNMFLDPARLKKEKKKIQYRFISSSPLFTSRCAAHNIWPDGTPRMNRVTWLFQRYRVCAQRPCWRSKTIKLFSFGKKFNSHAKIFLLFSPPTWPPRTYSIVTFIFLLIYSFIFLFVLASFSWMLLISLICLVKCLKVCRVPMLLASNSFS